jgi:hypothetical protein
MNHARKRYAFCAALAAASGVQASAAAPTAGPSLNAKPGLVEYGRGEVVLSGVVPSRRVGETVSILSRPCRFTEYAEIGTATTRAGGEFRYRLQPMLNTSFRVRAGAGTSRAVRVTVKPVVELEKTAATKYRITVLTTNPVFQNGNQVVLQRSSGSRWVDVKRGTLKKASPETAITVVSAVTLTARVTGTLRAVLPARQADCYLAGVSKSITSTRAS